MADINDTGGTYSIISRYWRQSNH